MISPWRFIVPPRFDSETHDLYENLIGTLTHAKNNGDEHVMRKIADDFDDIDELLDGIRALVVGTHPDILGLKPSRLTAPAPYTVRVLCRGDWCTYFRIQEDPPQGWAVCIVPKKTPRASIQQRLQEPIP
jgi:hypothetical protein